ncbi:hypothetical protein MBM09_05875 [Flaviramulus sp. BrNp1-15]|uniref:hypothetical protein n=1 Tax=Flaviramulus sp. BrNp1-15 TaxID=2916754 RepID=UPI001EE93816|nr:hypothetical protein [Flaviramulus sp. BrNp1-15]ULC60516.1 hypothetical protein MBM09_05875 [Flaviramulus sp. BrNp1-15]
MTLIEYDIDLHKTKIKTTNNEYFKTKESNMTFGQFGGKLNYNDKAYRFRCWQFGEKKIVVLKLERKCKSIELN